MTEQELAKFNNFRRLCLINSEDAIKTAESLLDKNINHIVLQLVVFGLEEIGKIFVGWYNISATENWDKQNYNIPLDDHIKKLFWAIWGPSFANEKFTKTQMEEIQKVASTLHKKRLDVMYTELDDTMPSSAKVSNEDAKDYVSLALARLELAKLDGEVVTQIDEETQAEMKWFMEATAHIEKRKYIFGDQSQTKLIEFGDVKDWISWLKEHFQTEERELKELLQKELEEPTQNNEKGLIPKWKIKIKLTTPSHSIRASELNKFNARNSQIKFSKGKDNHTLMIDFVLDKKTPIDRLWHLGWNYSNLFVSALNVATRGIFYWNITVNTEKYYEQIWDIENNRELEARLVSGNQLDWRSQNLYLREDDLALTFLVFRYFDSVIGSDYFKPINEYAIALGMLAKNDMHLRLESECFLHFFLSFKKALLKNESENDDFSVRETGYLQIKELLNERTLFDKVMDIGSELENNQFAATPITMTEIIAIKNYSSTYLLTLAVRKSWGNNKIILTKDIPPK